MTPMEILSPLAVKWLKKQLSGRLEGARGRNLNPQRHDNLRPHGVDQLSGLEDLDFTSPEVDFYLRKFSPSRPSQMSAEEEALWEESLETVEGFPDTQAAGKDLSMWYFGTSQEPSGFLRRSWTGPPDKLLANSLPTPSLSTDLPLLLEEVGGAPSLSRRLRPPSSRS